MPEFLFIRRAPAVRQNNRQSDLAIAEIVAAVFAHRCAVRHIINGVIDQLKCNAKVAAISVKRHLMRFAAFGDDRRYPASGGEQGSRLRADNVEVFSFRCRNLALGSELVYLALSNHGRGVRKYLEDF